MMNVSQVWTRFCWFMLPLIALVYFCQHHALFNDTLQFAGDAPLWYFDNNFKYFLLPDYADSGHPPGFGLYIAGLWSLFGKSLAVSHWGMLPFIALLVFQAVKLAHLALPNHKDGSLWMAVLLIFQASLIGQLSLISPDIIVLGLSFWMMNSIWQRKNISLAIAVLLVSLVSIRGMSIAVCMFLMKLWFDYSSHHANHKLKYLLSSILPFIWGGLVGLSYFVFHYLQKGWITPTNDTPWGPAFDRVPFGVWLKNMAVLVWRFLDLGGVGVVLLLAVLMFVFIRKSSLFNMDYLVKKRFQSILFLSIPLVLFTLIPLTLYLGLLTQRYLIFFSSLLIIISVQLLWSANFIPLKYKHVLLSIVLFMQLSGHFWLYPKTLSQSWDCTLAHVPYYDLRQDFLKFIAEEQIPRNKIVTEFPMHKSAAVLDYMSSDTFQYHLLNEVELEGVEYLWFSNVCNGLLKKRAYFDTHYEAIKSEKRGTVEMILYRRLDLKKEL